jgi:signal transduction histidine kinase
VRVCVATTRHELVFSVSDTGIGIAPRDVPHVFDRFWRAGDVRCEGVGLGLAICKSLVEASGGRIDIASEPGRGTTVVFTVPRAPSCAAIP